MFIRPLIGIHLAACRGGSLLPGPMINDLPAEEVRECEEAAKLGDVEAQYLMGMIYEAGMGGKDPDLNKAVYWYTKAAEHGSEEAREELRRLGLED